MFRENKYVYGNQVKLLYNVNQVCWRWCKGTGINNVLGVYQGIVIATVLMRYD